ncbi:S1 family peptidase [Plantactinospora sp. WMMB782]|uniref:S1 family peptidase n=1 Tax=Plantactinospora sp. WMMB782 TaxID=3404121 RepID=UPI003B960D39
MRKTNRLLLAGAMLLGVLAPAAPVAAVPGESPDVTPLIVGGRDATEPYPGMASLQRHRDGDPNWHACGAVLIHAEYLLTNAHCVANLDGTAPDPNLFHVRIGSHDRTSGGVVRDLDSIFVHADWDWGSGDNRVADIALLRLGSPVRLDAYAIPRLIRVDGPARLLGWGSTKPTGEGPAPVILQELDTRLLPGSAACAGAAPAQSEGEICVDSPAGSGACFGDSGGPALTRQAGEWVLVGTASRETNKQCGVGPLVYTSSLYYRSWIDEVIRTGTVPPGTGRAADPTAGSAADGHRWLAGGGSAV